MARKGENIYLRKDGRYEGRYIKARRPDGRAVFGSVYGHRYEEVKRKLTLVKAQQYQLEETVEQSYQRATMREWSEYWLEVLTRPFVKQTTYELYRGRLQNRILPFFGNCELESITLEKVQAFIYEQQRELSASTVKDVYRLLKAILRAAKERRLIQSEPWVGVRSKGRQAAAQPRVLSAQEQLRFERACISQNMPEFLVALYTGLRIGELAALRTKDIDFDGGFVRVRHAVHRVRQSGDAKGRTMLVLGETKNETSCRDVPIPAFLTDLLRERFSGMPPDAFLFAGRGGGMIDPRTLQARLQRLTQSIGLNGVHCHTLRHTYATRCLEKKIGVEVLAELLGHSSTHVTCQAYAHCTYQHKVEEVQKLQLLVGQI